MEEVEHNGSLGIQAIINLLNEYSSKQNGLVWDTTFVNISTLIRNNLDSNKSNKDIIQAVYTDIDKLLYFIYQYNTTRKDPPNVPYIVFYFPYYHALHTNHLRPPNKTTIRINTLLEEIKKTIDIKKQFEYQLVGNIYCFNLIAGDNKELPYKQLYNKCNKINDILSVEHKDIKRLTRRCMIVSHIPLDYYLTLLYTKSYVIDSYTAKVRTIKELGAKVFKNDYVPFNKYTHLTFGDSYNVRPIATRKNKQLFLDLAKSQRWNLMSSESILNAISATNQIPKAVLVSINI